MSTFESTRRMNSNEQMCFDIGYQKGKEDAVVHGQWIKYYHSYFGQHQCICSECKDDKYWKRNFCYGYESFCPNCGAKMDGGVENTEK